jgi:Putative beta-barrel porin-2, OmpL-like. bbp2
MGAGTGLLGLARWMGSAVVVMLWAGVTPAVAADPPADAKTATEAALAAPIAASPTRSVASDAEAATSQDPAAAAPSFLQSIEVYGLVDGYYGWAFNEVGPALRNFDVNHNNFSLSYVEFAIAKPVTEQSRAGFRADFGAGDTADLVNLFEPGGTNYLKYVQQAYVSYLVPAGKGLTVDFGKFVTWNGAEVIESKDNWNYSRSLLFALAIPYYHMGARFGYAVNDKVSVTGFLVNGWNSVKDNNDAKTVGASLTIKPTGKLTVIGNYTVGKEQADSADGGTRNLIDIVATYAATDKLSVLGNVDYGHDKVAGDGVAWSGVAVGVKYQATPTWAFSPRYELFTDSDGFATGLDQTVQEITLTGEYKAPAGLLARIEFRTDFSDEEFFTKDDGDFTKTQPTLTFSLVYAFSNK